MKSYAITQKFLPLQFQQKHKTMGNRILRLFYAVFMALLLVAVVAFMSLHIKAGLDSSNAKLLLGGYILILIWAGMRLFTLIKSLRQ